MMTRTLFALLTACSLAFALAGCSCESCVDGPPPFTRMITEDDLAALNSPDAHERLAVCQFLCWGDRTDPLPPDGAMRDAGQVWGGFDCSTQGLVLICGSLPRCFL